MWRIQILLRLPDLTARKVRHEYAAVPRTQHNYLQDAAHGQAVYLSRKPLTEPTGARAAAARWLTPQPSQYHNGQTSHRRAELTYICAARQLLYPLIRIFGDCGDQRIVIAFRSEGTPNADYTSIGIVWLMCGVRYRSRCSGVARWRFSATRVMGARRLREGRGLLRRWWRGGGFRGMLRLRRTLARSRW